MLKRLKYVIVKNGNLELPIVFSDALTHSIVSNGCGEAVSAGECAIFIGENNQIETDCYGKSVTLGVVSRNKIDAKIIKKEIVRNYY